MKFVKAFEIYQIRWNIEVLIKCRQYLGLGSYQGTDFDEQIADCTLCLMTHMVLTLGQFHSIKNSIKFRKSKVSHLPFYRLFQMIVSCNLQINNSLTFCKRKLMLYINSLLQHLMVTKQVGLLQAHQQSVYLPSNSPWYQPH